MRSTKQILALLAFGAALACEAATDPSELGDLGVQVTTTGPEPDPDGYRITVDGALARSLGVQDSTLFRGLAPGPHAIKLLGVARNCAVRGASQRSATVTAGATATVGYEVACSATAGLQVRTTSDGAPADPDGYQLVVPGQGTR